MVNSWVAEQLLALQEELGSVELGNLVMVHLATPSSAQTAWRPVIDD
jgi:hypothetical protein